MIIVVIIKSFVVTIYSSVPTIFDKYGLQTVPEPEETPSGDTECKEKRKKFYIVINKYIANSYILLYSDLILNYFAELSNF